MIIANKLRDTNRAEYLLYLWQVEDILRAYDCNIDRLRAEYLPQFKLGPEQQAQTAQWYADLCEMMLSEGVRTAGHLQMSQNVLDTLNELHLRLLASTRFPYYREMYYKVLPYVVELRSRGGDKAASELQTCFEALYGVLVLRLQHKEVSAETAQAVRDISTLLGQLSDYYFRDKAEPIEFE